MAREAARRYVPRPTPLDYPPIGYHGVIGDTHTAALVGLDGTIDWYCYPHFDDSPVFASLLDAHKGGHFTIQPDGGGPLRQLYFPETNVLLTRLLGPHGAIEITDLLPVNAQHVGEEQRHWHGLIRQVRAVKNAVPIHVACMPTFDYARQGPRVERTARGALFYGPVSRLELVTQVPLQVEEGGPGEAGVVAAHTLLPDQPVWFVLHDPTQADAAPPDLNDGATLEAILARTLLYWRAWSDRCTYRGRWRERVVRSALTLKLLTFSPTGAIIAAPTTSLPEYLGGERNWDYRLAWLRDSAFTLRALFRLGYQEEGLAFFRWLTKRIHDAPADAPIQPLYGLDGHTHLPEEILDHLEGYNRSRPVRKGNAAHRQRQLDVFGEVLETVSDYAARFGPPRDVWNDLVPLIDWLAAHWREADEGIWEIRGPPQQFVYSKIMCWVTFDRAVRLAERHGLPGAVDTWRRARDEVRAEVLARGVDPKGGHFTQTYGGEGLDAANLLIPLYGFLPAGDARVHATLEATLERLTTGDLVHRYQPGSLDDGLRGDEGAFSLCFFWLVDNLVLRGELDRAWLLFEQFLTYANHLQLYAEQVGADGQLLGNFPQGFTHIGLIYSALLLDTALGAKRS